MDVVRYSERMAEAREYASGALPDVSFSMRDRGNGDIAVTGVYPAHKPEDLESQSTKVVSASDIAGDAPNPLCRAIDEIERKLLHPRDPDRSYVEWLRLRRVARAENYL